MRLKSFYGPNLTEAMRLVRETLGDDVLIVATRDDEEMGGVRVTAAVDDPLSPPQAAPAPSKVALPLQDDGSAVIEILAGALLQHLVPAPLSEKLLATATQFASEDSLLAFGAALDTHFTFAALPDDKPLIFIGQPGAGKTLCVAKLATKATLANRPVCVIGTDTQRAGGMDQIAAFTRLLKSPLIETEDPHALKEAVSMQAAGTAILIDTAGCNPFIEEERRALEALVKASDAQTVIVVPADQDAFEAIDMVRAFAQMGTPPLLLFTRLDMTRRAGGLFRTSYETRLPLTLFSASAKVTAPLQPLNPVSLARLVLPAAETSSKTESLKKALP